MSVHISYRSTGRRRRGGGTRGTDYQNSDFVQEQRHGYWIRHDGLWKCSVCNLEQIEKFPICPMCDAPMDGEEE